MAFKSPAWYTVARAHIARWNRRGRTWQRQCLTRRIGWTWPLNIRRRRGGARHAVADTGGSRWDWRTTWQGIRYGPTGCGVKNPERYTLGALVIRDRIEKIRSGLQFR